MYKPALSPTFLSRRIAGSGRDVLTQVGPTLFVDIGFDAEFRAENTAAPTPGIQKVWALVDTGAGECCIDVDLARELELPIVDRRTVSGSNGAHTVDVYLAQIHIPSLWHTMYGNFSGVHLSAGGQKHRALIGRTFLQHFSMVYNGLTGDVTVMN